MQFTRRAALGLALAAAFSSGPALAQAWPAKPIKLIVPFPAGGGTDIIGRELAQKVAGATGWTIVVDNKPGSGGNLGVDATAKSPADGYTLVLGQTSNLAINPTLYSKLPYDPVKDLAPGEPGGQRAAGDRGGGRLALQDAGRRGGRGRSKPLALNYATSGNGTVAHLATELFQRTAGVQLTHVPYKGAAQGATDLIGGQVQLYVSSVPTLIGHIKNGKMRARGHLGQARRRPAAGAHHRRVRLQGLRGGDLVRHRRPRQAARGRGGAPEHRDQQGAEDARPAEEAQRPGRGRGRQHAGAVRQLIRDDIARWGKVVKESGAKVD